MRYGIKAALATALAGLAFAANAADLSYLSSLLNATPQGGWVKASTNLYSDAWATGLDAAPPSPSGPDGVINAWSSAAWDSTRGDLLLFGGGHANYIGNEVYVWDGGTGAWTRGSLPSQVNTSNYLVNGIAPQSAHTYETNVYAPLADRLVVFGGASWSPNGWSLFNASGRSGTWWWNPALADANKVGGATGTGWNPARLGANSWQSRVDPWTGIDQAIASPSFVHGTTAYRSEGGKDVIYVTMDQNASGFPDLWRYQLGTGGAADTWQQVGTTLYTVGYLGAATIDTSRGLFIKTATTTGNYQFGDLAVWTLANNNPGNPNSNIDLAVKLLQADGSEFLVNGDFGLDYDSKNDQLILWDGSVGGAVWVTKPKYETDGSLSNVWTVKQLSSTTATQPNGNVMNGVLGKWDYVAELGAFIAIDGYDAATQDAAVWLYKPMATAVPEPGQVSLMLVGLLFIGHMARRRLRADT